MHTSQVKVVIIGSAIALALSGIGGIFYYSMVSVPKARVNATAQALQDQAQQILAGAQMFRASRLGWPASFDELKAGRFLKDLPVPPQTEGVSGRWEIVAAGTPYYWLHNAVPRKVCQQFNLLVRGDDGIQVAARPSLKLQCFGPREPYSIVLGVGIRSGILNMSAVVPAIDAGLGVDDSGSAWVSRPTVNPEANLRSPVLASSVDFGTINIGSKSPKSVLITNHSKQPVHVSGVYGLPESVTLQAGGSGICPGTTFDLAANSSCTLSLVFNAENDIPLNGELTISSDYDGFRTISLPISGQGIDPVGTVRTMNSGCVSPDPFGYDAGRRMMITYGMYAGDLYGRNGWVTVAQGCPNDGEFAPYNQLSSPFVHGPAQYAEGLRYPRFDCPVGYDPLSLLTKNAAYDASSDTLVYTVTCHKNNAPSGVDAPGIIQIKRGTGQATMTMSLLSTEDGQNWIPLSANDNSAVYYVAANADNTGLELRKLDRNGRNGYSVVFSQYYPSFMKSQGVVDPREGNRYVWFPVPEGHQLAKVDTYTGAFVYVPMANMDHGTMFELMTNSNSTAMDSEGLLYTNGKTKSTITVTDTTTGTTKILSGTVDSVSAAVDGDATTARFQHINGLRLTQDEKYLMVADQSGFKYTMRKIRIRN